MNRLIFEQNPAFSAYVARALDVNGFGPHKTISITDEEQITAVIVYSRYAGIQCEVSIASRKPTWATRGILRVLFGYPFNQLGCERINAIIRGDNQKSISIVERLGFTRETTESGLRNYCNDGMHAHIYSLLKAECKWIKENYGRHK